MENSYFSRELYTVFGLGVCCRLSWVISGERLMVGV